MKSCFFVCLVILSIAVASDLKVFCVDRSSYKVGICGDSKCEKSVTSLEVCHKEGQSIRFDVEGQTKDVICQNPQVVCQDSVVANRTLMEDRFANDAQEDGETTDTEGDITTTPSVNPTITGKPTTIKPSTAAPTVGLPDEPIVIPEDVTGVVTENTKKVIQAKLEEQSKLTKEEIKTQVIAEKQIQMIINSKPTANFETTQKFMKLLDSSSSSSSTTTTNNNNNNDKIVITSTEAIDMTEYNKTDLMEKEFDGNNQEIILQFNAKKINNNKRERILANGENGGGDTTTEEDNENVITLQMFNEVNNTVIKNLRISVIVKNNNNNNLNPIEVRECGIFGRLNNVTLQNVVVIFYNPITFSCSYNNEDDSASGILVNEATDSTLNRIRMEFANYGNGLLYLNTTDRDIGLLIGSAENVKISNSRIIGDSLIVYGKNKGSRDQGNELVVGGMIAELNGGDNTIESSYIDLYFLSLYNEVSYGGLVGVSNDNLTLNKVSNYIRRGLTIGVKTDSTSFSFGGLVSTVKSEITVEDSWVSIKTYGIEANSTTTYFGGFIGNTNDKEVDIKRSYVRIYTGHKRLILESSSSPSVKIGYYFGDGKADSNTNLKLNETSAFVQGCTTIDCVYQPYYKLDIFTTKENTRAPEPKRLLSNDLINLVTGEGAMSLTEDSVLNTNGLNPPKFGFTNDMAEFAAQTSLQIGADGQIENPVNLQPPPDSKRNTEKEDIELKPVKEAVVVKKLCENDCNNHGVCQYGKCVCYPGYLPSTCLYRSCPYGTSLSNPSNEYEKDDRINYECSNQGICNRNTGLCECFAGYEGSACQRKSCPNQCSGHGVCETVGNVEMTENNDMIIHNDKEYMKWDKDHMQVCVCDKEYTGYDCSQKKCPYGYIQGNDCEAGDFTSITMKISKGSQSQSQSDITITSSGACQTTNQYVYLKYTDLWGRDWYTEKFDVGCKSGWENAIGRLPPGVISLDPIYGIEFSESSGSHTSFTVTIIFSKHQTGRQNILEVLGKNEVEKIPEIKNGGTFHTITNTEGLIDVTVTPEMDLVSPPEECSNAGICDRGTGLCKCFEGYIGVSCNQASSTL